MTQPITVTYPHSSDTIDVIIPAAGLGTRLKPLSSNSSKVMVPINGKPCLEYILEQIEYLPFENKRITIVDGVLDDVRDYVKARNLNCRCVKQGSFDGPLDAIKVGYRSLGITIEDEKNPVMIWLGDTLFLDPESVPEFKQIYFDDNFLVVKEVSDQSSWCVWEPGKLRSFVNKPSVNIKNHVALTGVYYFADGEKFFKSINDLTHIKTFEYATEISALLNLYEGKQHEVWRPYFAKEWYDIGDISNYHKTCGILLNKKARSFNDMVYDQDLNLIHKMPSLSNNSRSKHACDSLIAEMNWYKNLTWEQKRFVPEFIEETGALSLNYETGILLSDLLIYENLPISTWEYILDKVFTIMTKYFHKPLMNIEIFGKWQEGKELIWVVKSRQRANYYGYGWGIEQLLANVTPKLKPITGMHGDLHLGNIIYNPTTDKISLIDPRGSYGVDVPGVNLGDNIYDWAKLAHDVYYGYNFHVAHKEYERREELRKLFVSLCEKYDLELEPILAGGLVLLGTCLPLHDDEVAIERMKKAFEEGVKDFEIDCI